MKNSPERPDSGRQARTRVALQIEINMKLKALFAVVFLAIGFPVAQAHVTLENTQAPAGSYYKATLRVPHGCAGSDTLRLRVRIPEGLLTVRPQPKPGWTLETVEGAYERPEELHGSLQETGVREIRWSGKLPAAWYDEFGFMGFVSSRLKPGEKLYLPVVQECEEGVERWIEQPAEEARSHPAPWIEILPAARP